MLPSLPGVPLVGGAGGWGAVVTTGSAGLGTLTTSVTGGNGGNGGSGAVGAGGGSGGHGLFFTSSGVTVAIDAAMTGGNGSVFGVNTFNAAGAPGVGGTGIVGSGLNLALGATVSGGLSGNGTIRANALSFTSGANSLTLNAGWGLIGNISVAGSLAITSPSDTTLSNAIAGAGSVSKTGSATMILTGDNSHSGVTTLGVRAEATLGTELPLIVHGLVGWRHAFGEVTPSALLAFAGGASAFSVAGIPIDRNAMVAEAGLDWKVSKDMTLGVSYAGQIGTRPQNHAIKGSFNWRFETRSEPSGSPADYGVHTFEGCAVCTALESSLARSGHIGKVS